MAEKDLTEKYLEGFRDVFADIHNVLLFQEELIREEELNMIRVFTNDSTYDKIESGIIERAKAGEVITMCTFAEEMTNKGIKIGEARGIEIGEARGIQMGIAQDKINVARNLLDILSDEVIAEKVELDIQVVRSLRS